jgi:hypothetical protein
MIVRAPMARCAASGESRRGLPELGKQRLHVIDRDARRQHVDIGTHRCGNLVGHRPIHVSQRDLGRAAFHLRKGWRLAIDEMHRNSGAP